MGGTALHFALRELRRHFSNPRTVVGVLVVGLVLGFAGPFGTFETLPLLQRLAYWLVIAGLTYGVGFFLSMYADAAFDGSYRPFGLRLVIMAMPAGIAATLIVLLLTTIAYSAAFSLLDLLVLFVECTAVSLAVVTLVLFLMGRPAPSAAMAPEAEVTKPAPILDRVQHGQRGQLLALSVEDHYVDVITERGKTLVLMRLADAIRETSGVEGVQIHRSHWVARCAVVKAHRSDGKVLLELTNGMRLPVSRGFLPAVREAGLA